MKELHRKGVMFLLNWTGFKTIDIALLFQMKEKGRLDNIGKAIGKHGINSELDSEIGLFSDDPDFIRCRLIPYITTSIENVSYKNQESFLDECRELCSIFDRYVFELDTEPVSFSEEADVSPRFFEVTLYELSHADMLESIFEFILNKKLKNDYYYCLSLMLADIAFNPNNVATEITEVAKLLGYQLIVTEKGVIAAAIADSIEANHKGQQFEIRNRAVDEIRGEYRNKKIKAAKARHKMSQKLKEEAIKIYKDNSYKSMKNAAENIFKLVQQFADENGITRLSEYSGRETVYKWIREHNKTD